MIRWLLDHYLCWRYGHITENAGGAYAYCTRCGHLEIIKRGA